MSRKREIGSRLATQISLRLPEDLRKRVAEAAGFNGRSKNTEIIMRLEDSFAAADDAGAGDVGMDEIKRELTAIKREMKTIKDLLLNQK